MSAPLATGREGLRVTGSLTRQMIENAREVRPNGERVGKAARISASVVAPLVVGLITGHVTWGLAATFGAFTSFHGHREPYPQRARLLAAMVLAYLGAVLLGTLASTSDVALVVVTGVASAVAAFVCQALALPAPREYMLILICLIVGALPAPLASTPGLIGLTLAGGAWAWLVLMSGWLTDRERPEREAVVAGLKATLGLLDAPPPVSNLRRHQAVLDVRNARRSVEFANGPTSPLLRDIQLRSEDLLDRSLGATLPVPRGSGSRKAGKLAPATGEHEVVSIDPEPGTPPSATDAPVDPRDALRLTGQRLLTQTGAALPRPGLRPFTRAGDRRPALRTGLWSLRNALSRQSIVLPAAGRIGVGVAAGLALGVLSGAPRPYWIALTTAAVLQGATLLMTTRRSIERATGTAVGVLMGGAIVALDPVAAVIVAGIAVFLFLGELTIATSYVVGVTFLTPMTLLLSEVGSPGLLTSGLVGWRLGDTVIGCALGIAAGRFLWPSSERHRLDHATYRALDAIARVLEHSAAEQRGPHRWYRRELRIALLDLRAVIDAGLGDRLTSSPQDDLRWPVLARVQQLGYLTLAARGNDTAHLRRDLTSLRTTMREPATVQGEE